MGFLYILSFVIICLGCAFILVRAEDFFFGSETCVIGKLMTFLVVIFLVGLVAGWWLI